MKILNLILQLSITKQTLKILKKINKKTKVIISIFAGRSGDVGKDPIPEFKKVLNIQKNSKMWKYYGQVFESLITIPKLNKLVVI